MGEGYVWYTTLWVPDPPPPSSLPIHAVPAPQPPLVPTGGASAPHSHGPRAAAGHTSPLRRVLQILLMCLSLMAVVVPKGLHLIVTAALASIAPAMLRRRCLVRTLAAVEAAGCSSAVVCNKSHVLSAPDLRVTRGWIGGQTFDCPAAPPAKPCPRGVLLAAPAEAPVSLPVSPDVILTLCEHLVINSAAALRPDMAGDLVWTGDKLDVALLQFVQRLGARAGDLAPPSETVRRYPFCPNTKRVCTLVHKERTVVLHMKGAADLLLHNCTSVMQV